MHNDIILIEVADDHDDDSIEPRNGYHSPPPLHYQSWYGYPDLYSYQSHIPASYYPMPYHHHYPSYPQPVPEPPQMQSQPRTSRCKRRPGGKWQRRGDRWVWVK